MVFHWRVDQRRNPNPQTSPIYATQNNRIRNIKLQESFWGLFVYLQVTGIFTGIVFSPSCAPRQFPSRYTIRARLNLPDTILLLFSGVLRVVVEEPSKFLHSFTLPCMAQRVAREE